MSGVIGIAGFGLRDCISEDGKIRIEKPFNLAHVLASENLSDSILAGKRAEESRVQTGLHWPTEARIYPGEPIRRAPISCVWRALVEAGDRMGRWYVGKGISIPLSKLIAAHVVNMFDEVKVSKNDKQVVLAIPNQLDEYGQENLLRELAACGHGNTMLLWRPVAAALSWLDKVEGDFIPQKMHPDDHIHIVYLGADAIEFSTLRLRPRKYEGLWHILPLRDREKDLPSFTGLDWAGRLIQKIMPDIDFGAYWQVFSSFPDIWEAIAGKTADGRLYQRPLSSSGKWTLWNMPSSTQSEFSEIRREDCGILRKIIDSSFKLMPLTKNRDIESIHFYLRNQLLKMTKRFPDGNLRGMIITGPLAREGIPKWFNVGLDSLKVRGLNINGNLSEPEIDNLWLCPQCNEPISDGACVYGRRRLQGIPSYLDTMPQLSVLAIENARFKWVPLLDAQEVLGGEEHKDRICGKFQLKKGQNTLEAYLCKGPIDEAQSALEESSNPMAVSCGKIPLCHARVLRQVVRRLGSLQRVQSDSFFQGGGDLASYGILYAKTLYSEEADALHADQARDSDDIKLEMSRFRLANINFLSAPSKDVKLDIDVRMRPASGLAKVEVIPDEPAFLHGRKVRLDYGKMRPPEQLPRFKRGWPTIQELVVDPQDENLKNSISLVRRFESFKPDVQGYNKIIDSIRDRVLKGTIQKKLYGDWFYFQSIDQEGLSCTEEGNAILDRVAAKFEKDFHYLNSIKQEKWKDWMLTRAAWMYWRTPDNIVEYIKDVVMGDCNRREWLYAVDSASRCFLKIADYHILFESIARRIERPQGANPFPIQSSRGIWRILMLRADGVRGLDRDLSRLFAEAALKRLLEEQHRNNFNQLYFQLIRFLLYLLRYRKKDPGCFNPEDSYSMEVFEHAMKSMNSAKEFFSNRRNFGKAEIIEKISDGFERYLYYQGSEDLLILLSEEAGGID